MEFVPDELQSVGVVCACMCPQRWMVASEAVMASVLCCWEVCCARRKTCKKDTYLSTCSNAICKVPFILIETKKKRQHKSLPAASSKSINSMWNAFVSHGSRVNAFSFEDQPFKTLFYSTRRIFILRKPLEKVTTFRCNITHIVFVSSVIYVRCECATKNQ